MKAINFFALAAIAWGSAFTLFAQTWRQASLPDSDWICFASSADGKTLVAAPDSYPNGFFFVSTNGGVTWRTNNLPTLTDPVYGTYPISFVHIASSADGIKLAGVYVGGTIFTSTNSGTTWITNNAPSAAWYSIASSADGTKLTAVAGGGYNTIGSIYVSTNSGVTWMLTSAPSNHWRSVASSADGTRIIVGSDPGPITIYTSTNSGTTWLSNSLPINKQWTVASSADGNKMVAAYFSDGPNIPGHIFTSTDSGSTWVSNQLASSFFESVALSADGNKIVAVTQDPVVFISTDFGTSWVTTSLPGGGSGLYFQSVASSADGGKLITGSLLGQLAFVSQSICPPQMSLAPLPANLSVSWIIPSTNFVLQQSFDLTEWTDLTNSPALNLTNLQNQVALPLSASNGFYRLKTP
jgi:photosystem II stability/assembly factor-like uncharacterized protein